MPTNGRNAIFYGIEKTRKSCVNIRMDGAVVEIIVREKDGQKNNETYPIRLLNTELADILIRHQCRKFVRKYMAD